MIPNISVIISYYKNSAALGLILKALDRQTYTAFEVIVSEDDNNPTTATFIEEQRQLYRFPIKHLNQETDEGFRKNIMLNRSLQAAAGEMIVFLDGDCIPHSKFLQAYVSNLRDKVLCFGRRVMLDAATTEQLYKEQDLRLLHFTRLLTTKTSRLKYAIYFPFVQSFRDHGIWGCNYGVFKRHLMEINGFDEDYITAGVGEDVDIEWRLRAIGVKFKSIRHSALQFHLHHKENYSDEAIQKGMAQLKVKQSENHYFCRNGIAKISEIRP